MIRDVKTSLARKAAVATVVAAAAFGAAQANAGVIQLGFILDESGSIGSSNYSIIQNGLANAINTLVPITGAYEISVVSFATTAQTLVNHVLIDSAAARTSVANAILADTFSGGSTAMDAAFNAMATALIGSTQVIDSTYVNFATDGVPNSQAAATTARNNMITNASVDNISIEAIGAGVDAAYLQGSICYPQACDTTSPYNFPTQGFYIGVADAQGYADAIGNKIKVVTNQVPEPEMLVVFAIGLLGLGIMRRRAA